MKFISTRNPSAPGVDLKEAVLRGLPPDNGLYVPDSIGRLPEDWLDGLPGRSFADIAQDVAQTLLGDAITPDDLRAVVEQSVTFDAPLHRLDEETAVLELFHGPTLAFKDFGARFMAAMMGWMVRDDERGLTVLVATSGDTGGAVAAGFHNVPGIRVVVLYPSGRVSPLQEKQLTALGGNITAFEVAGSFDDCQALVKQAFLDPSLAAHLRLTSANSISLARLIPQSFYYFRAYQQLGEGTVPPVFSVPSGNFGNLTAGLLAKRIGLPVARFLAATNANDEVPEYLESGVFSPRPSIATISNAMDVGNPSNFARMLHLYGGDVKAMRRDITGAAFTDAETRDAMRQVHEETGYVLDPHAAVAWLAWDTFRGEYPATPGVLLGTAHPAKFLEVVEPVLGCHLEVPERLARLARAEKHSVRIRADYASMRDALFALPPD